jgi:hypothetical protein
MDQRQYNLLKLALAYFILSAVITWLFIVLAPGYISYEQMLLSNAIAGGKWGLQIMLGFFLLRDKRWGFIKNIGFVCFAGSCMLIPYILLSWLQVTNSMKLFTASLILAVALMIILYRRAVLKTGIGMGWWWFMMLCIGIAVSLQLTLVFHIVP